MRESFFILRKGAWYEVPWYPERKGKKKIKKKTLVDDYFLFHRLRKKQGNFYTQRRKLVYGREREIIKV